VFEVTNRKRNHMQAIIRIELADIDDPVVWRRISVPFHFHFHQLHLVIQSAMGWRDSHFYSFSENGFGDLIAITSPYDEESGIDARNVPTGKLLLSVYNSGIMREAPRPLVYIYDYGDSWEHLLFVEAVTPEQSKKADLIDGAGACPPEDSGGLPGFQDLKKSLRTGRVSEIHGESWIPWLNETGYRKYDPEVFDLERARKGVRRVG
jgi:hypothetical protein